MHTALQHNRIHTHTMTDSQSLIEIADGWRQVLAEDNSDAQILEAYQRLPDGLVLALEEGVVTGNRYSIAALPENWRDDNQPIREYGDNGYLWEGDDIDTGKEELETAMETLAYETGE